MMAKLARLLFGKVDEENPIFNGTQLPRGTRFMLFSDIGRGRTIVVRTYSGAVYRLKILDFKESRVEVLESSSRFFGQTPVVCTYLGAVSAITDAIYPRMIMEGACMAFCGVPSPAGNKDRSVNSSVVVNFWVEE